MSGGLTRKAPIYIYYALLCSSLEPITEIGYPNFRAVCLRELLYL